MQTKQRKCKICKMPFYPARPLQKACSMACALLASKKVRAKAEAAEQKLFRESIKRRKLKLKTRQEWIKDAQQAFNAYIRERDIAEPCISCGRHHQGQWHAGHYRTTAAAGNLRFDEKNVHKQCAPCNNHKSGNVVEYRIRLAEKIGMEELERIEHDNETRKWTVEELQAIKREYSDKLKHIRG